MELRRIHDEECDDLGRLTIRAYRELFPGDDLGDYENVLADVASRHVDSEVYVALDERGVLLGGVTFVPDHERSMSEFDDPDAAGIRTLAVDPSAQGQGVGRALTARCVERSRELGRQRIILHSTPPMTVARAMYERLGFRPSPSLDIWIVDEHGDPFQLIAYTLELTSLSS